MSAWIATALAVATAAMSAITVVNAGSCGPGGTHNCFNLPTTIDFSSVPEISNQIVSEEKPGQKIISPRASHRRRLRIRARFLGQNRDQDERRSLAIPGHWSDGTVRPRSDCVPEPNRDPTPNVREGIGIACKMAGLTGPDRRHPPAGEKRIRTLGPCGGMSDSGGRER
jgi:hypothetical protein